MSLRNYTKTDQKTRSNTREVKNNAGGYVYKVNDNDRFIRALTLGSDKGTFYVNAKTMAQDTIMFMKEYIASNGVEAVNTIVEISDSGRAQKNTPAIFALAIALNDENDETKAAAREAVNKVCRTFFHLTELAADLDALGAGWGPAKRKAFAKWYETKDSDQLAYAVSKYRSRNKYTHRDIMRLSHPKIQDKNLASFILNLGGAEKDFNANELPQVAQNYIKLSQVKTAAEAVKIMKSSDSGSAWEFLPTDVLNNAEIWTTLMETNSLGYGAMVRNLNRFVKTGVFEVDGGKWVFEVAQRLTDADAIKKSRIHPMNILNAIRKNESGYDYYGSTSTSSLPAAVLEAAESALELAFKNVEPSNKVFYIGVDVSGSMGSPINGSPYSYYSSSTNGEEVSCRDFAALLASQVARNEKKYHIMGFSHKFIDLKISGKDTYSSVVKKMSNIPFGSTDCALPILTALEKGIYVDEFVVITDSETYQGNVKVVDALKDYRKKVNPNARFVVVACTPTEFTIGDPEDKYTLNISGADAAVLSLISDFAKD